MVSKIQARLVTILETSSKSDHIKRPKVVRQSISFEREAVLSPHLLAKTSDKVWFCARCHGTTHQSSGFCRSWMQSPCIVPEVSDWTAPVKVPNWTLPMRGKQSPDVSHDLYSFKDVLFCNICGNIGAKQLRLLAKPCSRHANDYGKLNLESFWNSKLTSRINIPEHSYQQLVGGRRIEQVPQSASPGQML